MRVEPGDEDARVSDVEAFFQVGIDDAERFHQILALDGARDFRQGQMRRRKRHAQAAPDQHHHHVRGAGVLGEIFGVTGEGNAGIVDHALLHRRGDHRVEFAAEAAGNGAVEHGEHVGAVRRIELSGHRGMAQRKVFDLRGLEERAVADHHHPRAQVLCGDALAKLGTDAGRLTRGERDHRALYRSSRRSST
jgi:hypothetical protein